MISASWKLGQLPNHCLTMSAPVSSSSTSCSFMQESSCKSRQLSSTRTLSYFRNAPDKKKTRAKKMSKSWTCSATSAPSSQFRTITTCDLSCYDRRGPERHPRWPPADAAKVFVQPHNRGSRGQSKSHRPFFRNLPNSLVPELPAFL